jgi:hypothetical protein
MIRDYNRSQVLTGTVFHFKNSLRSFVVVDFISENKTLFVDLHEGFAYSYDDLEYEGLEFYEKEDDEDFKGVDVVDVIRYAGKGL